MSTPIPPTIPADGQFQSVQVDQYLKNASANGNIVSNGYVTEKGAVTTINGVNQNYSTAAIAGGIIIRTDMSELSNDVLPSATDLATELGLPAVDGSSYRRTFVINNYTSYYIELTGSNWTFFPATSSIAPILTVNFYYNLTYSSVSGWNIFCLSAGFTQIPV